MPTKLFKALFTTDNIYPKVCISSEYYDIMPCECISLLLL